MCIRDSHKDATPLLVFDEIDANVGGEVARAVGFKMQQLGNRHQVISITHFPQVAALASHHYLVQKASAGNRTISCLREVSHEERVDELVRMLGGGGDSNPLSALSELDPQLLQAGLRLFSEYSATDDRKVALLNALKPFVKPERYAKVDKAVQIAKLARVIRVAFQLFQSRREEGKDDV